MGFCCWFISNLFVVVCFLFCFVVGFLFVFTTEFYNLLVDIINAILTHIRSFSASTMPEILFCAMHESDQRTISVGRCSGISSPKDSNLRFGQFVCASFSLVYISFESTEKITLESISFPDNHGCSLDVINKPSFGITD